VVSESGTGQSNGHRAASQGTFYVGQIAKILNVTPSALRAWENHGLIKPERTSSGYRIYSMSDVERARRIKGLTEGGANLASVKILLEAEDQLPSDRPSPAPRNGSHAGRTSGHLGERMRRLRTAKDLSIRQLAVQVGMSPSYLSSIERAGATPTLASIQKIAAVLGSSVQSILAPDEEQPRSSPLMRAAERRVLESGPRATRIEDLSAAGSQLESLAMTLEPGAGSEGAIEHEGEEFVYILSGRLQVTLDGVDVYELGPHDSMSFASTRPHHWMNYGDENVELLWINTPRTF
jgi:DNA-binding transcriptional MerR regulator